MFELTIKAKSVQELSDIVVKLGGVAEQGEVKATPKEDTSFPPNNYGQVSQPRRPLGDNDNSAPAKASSNVTKKDLMEQAQSLGISVNSRETKAEIEKKIEEHKTGVPSQPTQPVTPPAGSVPGPQNFGAQPQAQPQQTQQGPPAFMQQAPQQVNPQNAAQASVQPQQPVHHQAPQHTTPAFDRQTALQSLGAELGKLAKAGVPEAQILPLVQKECQAVGAPLGKKLSELEDQHLSAVLPRVQQVISNMLNQGQQASSFV